MPSDILFSTISSMTGGLVTDITTAMIGMLVIGFLLMGLDYLKDVLDDGLSRRSSNNSLEKARSYRKMSDSMDDQVSKDYLNAKYRNEIRRAAR